MPVRWLLNRMPDRSRLSLEDIPMSKTRTTLAVTALCLGLLAVAALASPVTAKGGDEDRSGPRREAAEERMENRTAHRDDHTAQNHTDRMDRHERMRAAHDAWQECKRDANATGNQSMKDRCGDEKSFFLNATKARREAHALHGGIAALERRLGRLEAREIALEQELAGGNLTANETAELEARIAQIDSHQERMAERLEALKDRLEARHARWHAVIDDAGEDDGDDED